MLNSNLPLKKVYSGKIRETYDLNDDHFLMIATDRISAFDVVFSDSIPKKGEVLTDLTVFWLEKTKHIVNNHLISKAYFLNDEYKNRSLIVKKAKPFPIECIVRGYLAGSGFKEYTKNQTVCGQKLKSGLKMASELETPIFTPSTKAQVGEHDQNISIKEAKEIIGDDLDKLEEISIALYDFAKKYAKTKGIILADTKFEFGKTKDGEIILIDEILTPDSSRYWPVDTYVEGKSPQSLDKQFLRDYLSKIDWDKNPPAPKLPEEIIQKTTEKYLKIRDLLIN